MKKIIFIFLVFFAIGQSKAQDYTKSLQGIKKVKISSESGVSIKVNDQNELRIVGDGHETPEKARGLKAVYAGGSDNTGLGMYVQKEGEILVIKNLKGMYGKLLEMYLPKTVNIVIEKSNLGNVTLSGFTSEIEATTNVGYIKLEDVTGPVVAKTATGEINVVFTKVSQSSPISLISATGAVDVSLPSATPANLELKTSMGEIYTDFDIKFPVEDNNMKIVGGKRAIKTKLNNGGVQISLRSSTGNIYLRKQ
ncbi:DUF4097 family beta strand repeat-containing protein [Aquimarina celericrescens]|uniref:DUF4097 domain-containing protein n=1 Tax=Aquimarina celericrescens TaxID=1964542 RepID=A0ABW5AUW2_9FLAO|nr:DUF4097 family beta strand repeat protein [Aquimarina celericrescens]